MANVHVDSYRTISNDINEIYEIFGIEAARQALYNEIDDILNSTTSVNYRHIALLVDTMTCKGYLLSIDRHGINRTDIGPLAKCSFEETSDILIKAGVFGEVDRINGVSANIMLGQIAKCGTGDSDFIMDISKLSNVNQMDNFDDDLVKDFDDNEDDDCNLLSINYEAKNNIDDVKEMNSSLIIK